MNHCLTGLRIVIMLVLLCFLTSCLLLNPDHAAYIYPRYIAPATGDGTADNPYHIESLENLNWIASTGLYSNDPDQSTRFASHYIQTADIDASLTASYSENIGFFPIGRGEWENTPVRPFTGSYDGQGYTIDKLHVTRTVFIRTGFFACTDGATIKNVTLTNVNVRGDKYTGGLIGFSRNTLVSNCFVTGTVRGNTDVGGLIGRIDENSVITSCQSSVKVAGDHYAGGLAGHQFDSVVTLSHTMGSVTGSTYISGLIGRSIDSTISKSWSSSTVTGDTWVGGIAGYQFMSVVTDCYSIGRVTGRDTFVGGLIGRSANSAILNSFSTGYVSGTQLDIGGLTGKHEYGEVSNCYWNIETSGLNYSAVGEGRTTEDMTFPYAANTYMEWDFTEIWRTDPDHLMNDGYPYLVYNPPPQALSGKNMTISHKPVSEDIWRNNR